MERFDPQKIEEKILSYWKEKKIYEKAKGKNEDEARFRFIDGPPYTTGAIHLGTAWNKVLKDSYLRYKRMRGFNVRAQPGYDMHGLPIEVKVEENLGIRNKKEISEKLGEEKFVEECKNFALKNLEIMSSQFKRLGVWMDWENSYMTIKNSYIEGAWWALKEAHKNGLLYEGPRVISWCTRCATALAKHELEYENISDISVFVKFGIEGKNDEFVLIWTTTPWTLPANMFVAVNPDFEYVKVKVGNEKWLLAKQLAGSVLGSMDKKFEIIETFSGSDLKGLRYVHPFEDEILSIKKFKNENRAVCSVIPVEGNFVTLEAGCGCVHGSPGTGAEDFDASLPYKMQAFCPVDENGFFTDDAGKLKGMRAKKDDAKIVSMLKEKGLLVHEVKVTHEYPLCWRCKTPVIFRATPQWYLAVSKLKKKMISENKKIKWTPEWAGSNWFRDWLENMQDWCISRQRFWGIPLPIWKCKNNHIKVIGLRKELPQNLKDLHRPWIDKVNFDCGECNEKMSRVSDILDVWLDSGAATWATLPYPESKEELQKWWPADFITEGKDQIRGWFNSQMCLSMLAFGKPPYKSVYMHGFVSDNKGMKMSKSLGNIVTPEEVMAKVGADAFRFYAIGAPNAGEDLRFSWNDLTEAYKVMNIFWNTAQFLEYMKLENFNPEEYVLNKNKLKPEDLWLLSRANGLNEKVTHAFENNNFEEVPRMLQNFIVEDISRWYIKLIRGRTWVSAKSEDKLIAFKVLYECFKRFLLLSAPVIPMISECIYLNAAKPLGKKLPESVHLFEWPKPEKNFVSTELENAMKLSQEIVEAVRFAREEAKVKLRWPLKTLAVETSKENEKLISVFKNVIKEQANVKTLKFGRTKGVEKEFLHGKIFLDTEITQDIFEEALLREVMRAVQVLRKENNFRVGEKISLSLSIADESFANWLRKFAKELSEKVGAEELKISQESAKGAFKGELDFERKRISIAFDKIG